MQQQPHTSRASSEDGRDNRLAWEAQIAELQQLKADLLAAQTRLRDAGGLMVLRSKMGRAAERVASSGLFLVPWLHCQRQF